VRSDNPEGVSDLVIMTDRETARDDDIFVCSPVQTNFSAFGGGWEVQVEGIWVLEG
jgi:hypothetical protein